MTHGVKDWIIKLILSLTDQIISIQRSLIREKIVAAILISSGTAGL